MIFPKFYIYKSRIILALCSIAVSSLCAVVVFQRVRSNQYFFKTTSLSKIQKESNTKNPVSSLKYYYEPLADSQEADTIGWLQKPVVWRYNNETLNDRYDYPIEKPPSTLRIVALGDSFTFGDHVNTADSWPEQLEDLFDANVPCSTYTHYEVLNLGLRGFDIQNEVERFRIRGMKYDPDLVIWLFYPNDFTQVRELMQKRSNEIQESIQRHGSVESVNTWIQAVIQSEDEFHKKYSEEEILKMQRSFLRQFDQMYKKQLIIAMFPDMDTVFRNELKEWAKREGAVFFNGLPTISADPNLHFIDDHPTEEGHKQIALRLYEYILTVPALCRGK